MLAVLELIEGDHLWSYTSATRIPLRRRRIVVLGSRYNRESVQILSQLIEVRLLANVH